MEGRPLDDSELVRRARRGEVGAYEELVKTYQGIAFRTAFLVTRDSGDAEDAAQSAFIKAYYALGRFREEAAFRPWILRIVVNEARNLRRSSGRRERAALRLAEGRPADDAAPSPEAAALISEARRDLMDAVNSLPEKDRMVIACRYFLDLSEAEAAAVLGIRRGTVKSRLSRALARLRDEMGTVETGVR